MSFQPVVPLGGFAGWQFLQRTMESQREAFDAAPRRQRDAAYFEANIGRVRTAEALVGDRRLLSVALGAFGLGEDINNRAFIRKVLEEGTTSRDALAMKLTDRRYREFSAAFGFGDAGARTGRAGFGQDIVEAYLTREFEIGVGETDETMRLALNLDRELPEIASRSVSDDTKWLTVLGNPPLRRVFETAFGLPQSFGALDLDRQLEEFKDRAARSLGIDSFTDFAEADQRAELTRRFLALAQIRGDFGAGGGAFNPAVALLGSAASGLPGASTPLLSLL
jgi:hypothetical protein